MMEHSQGAPSLSMPAESRHRGRTAGYPTAPAQSPACGFLAPGSSAILASALQLRSTQWPVSSLDTRQSVAAQS
jgi:hypothetical protein